MSNVTSDELIELAAMTGKVLEVSGHRVVTAESCTGGGIMQTLTEIAGSSAWCEGGFITYSNEAKQAFLGISEVILNTHGAVSAETVQAMVSGALEKSTASLAIAVSGIAGPGGGSVQKPVGTVWIAWAERNKPVCSEHFLFSGDRAAVRRQTIYHALIRVTEYCKAEPL